jgi:hypothetical protein
MSEDPWAIWHKGGEWSMFVEGTVFPKLFLLAMGFVTVAFSELDIQIDHTIANLLGVNRDTGDAIAAAAFGYKPRIDLLRRLIPLRIIGDDAEMTETRNKLDKIAMAALVAMDQRNRLIHDYMASYDHGEAKISYRRKESNPSERKASVIATKASLKALGVRMTDLSYRLQRFRKGDPRWKQGEQFPSRDR